MPCLCFLFFLLQEESLESRVVTKGYMEAKMVGSCRAAVDQRPAVATLFCNLCRPCPAHTCCAALHRCVMAATGHHIPCLPPPPQHTHISGGSAGGSVRGAAGAGRGRDQRGGRPPPPGDCSEGTGSVFCSGGGSLGRSALPPAPSPPGLPALLPLQTANLTAREMIFRCGFRCDAGSLGRRVPPLPVPPSPPNRDSGPPLTAHMHGARRPWPPCAPFPPCFAQLRHALAPTLPQPSS